jgi:hypothetical protein
MRFSPPIRLAVAKTLAESLVSVRPVLEQVRARIFDVADRNAAIRPVSETLKWGTPLLLGLSRLGGLRYWRIVNPR